MEIAQVVEPWSMDPIELGSDHTRSLYSKALQIHLYDYEQGP